MPMEIIRAASVYAAIAGSLSASSTIVVGATALAAEAAIWVPWLSVLSLVVACPISLFVLQRSRLRPPSEARTAPARDYLRLRT